MKGAHILNMYYSLILWLRPRSVSRSGAAVMAAADQGASWEINPASKPVGRLRVARLVLCKNTSQCICLRTKCLNVVDNIYLIKNPSFMLIDKMHKTTANADAQAPLDWYVSFLHRSLSLPAPIRSRPIL